MLDDPTPSPAADAAASPPPAQPSQSAPEPSRRPSEMFAFSKVFEGSDVSAAAPDDASVSNGGERAPEVVAATVSDAKPAPAPAEGVTATDAPGPGAESDPPETPEGLSRRQQKAAEKDARIAELEAQAKSFDREAVRAEILAEEAQKAASTQSADTARADGERFELACRLADTDPRLVELVPGTDLTLYQWREDRKDLIARYPEAERAIRAEAERYVQQATASADQAAARGWQQIQADLVTQIASSESLPGVEKDALKQQGLTWKDMAETIHAAGAAWKEAELSERVTKAEADAARLEKENEDLRAQARGGRRAPAVVGRTAGAAPSGGGFDPSRGWRGNLAAAFDFPTNGTG